jgi:hypothetical protein
MNTTNHNKIFSYSPFLLFSLTLDWTPVTSTTLNEAEEYRNIDFHLYIYAAREVTSTKQIPRHPIPTEEEERGWKKQREGERNEGISKWRNKANK